MDILKLDQKMSKTITHKINIFNKNSQHWNRISKESIGTPSLASFKTRLDRFHLNKPGTIGP